MQHRIRTFSLWLAAVTALALPASARAGDTRKSPEVAPATVEALVKEIKRPGAELVLVNVWATWCEPCKEEMPDILRAYREHRPRGVRLVLVSADPQDSRAAVSAYLGKLGVDFKTFLKTGDDMAFIDGLDPKWDGTLPATMLFDGKGKKLHLWSGVVTHAALKQKLDQILAKPRRREP